MGLEGGVVVSESETTAKILDAAQELFLRDGYAGVNLDQIGRASCRERV